MHTTKNAAVDKEREAALKNLPDGYRVMNDAEHLDDSALVWQPTVKKFVKLETTVGCLPVNLFICAVTIEPRRTAGQLLSEAINQLVKEHGFMVKASSCKYSDEHLWIQNAEYVHHDNRTKKIADEVKKK